MVDFQEVTSGYFDVLRIPVPGGRGFDRGDADRTVAIVNETMARRVGARIGSLITVEEDKHEVVGIAKDAYLSELDRVDETLYLPFTGKYGARLLVREHAAHALAALVARMEPRAELTLRPLKENVERWLRPSRVASAGGMGVLALAMASVGMFGVFAYSVRQRTREIGMRMALGAQRSRVVLEVLLSSSRAIGAGLAIGFAGALAASAWPVRAISKVDPMTALRCE
jgi:putative ABC transport system permease protein